MKILVIGCGSIGRRHIRLLREMGVEVEAYDTSERIRSELRTEFPGMRVSTGMESALFWPRDGVRCDGAIIATPNHLHHEAAIEVLDNNLPILIEKPIAHTVAVAQRIVFYTHVADGTVLIGYSLRFHPGLRLVKKQIDSGAIGAVRHASIHFGSYLPDWRPGFDYRKGYAAHQETGGGILLDASHELDYACWLFGRPVSVMAQIQNTGALEISTEDVADLVVRFESGAQANIHLDYLSRKYRRTCTIVGDTGNLDWDFSSKWTHEQLDQMKYPGGWAMKKFELDDMYRAELKHFLACIRGEEKPLATVEDGIHALLLVEAAKLSSAEGRVVAL